MSPTEMGKTATANESRSTFERKKEAFRGCRAAGRSTRMNDFTALVLIVEADAEARLMLRYLLEIWKYRVVEAADSRAAIKRALENQPDLVVMNTNLPDMDGLSASRRMRESPALENAEFIFISAVSDLQSRASALAEGVRAVFTKPIDFGELEKTLDFYTKNKKIKK